MDRFTTWAGVVPTKMEQAIVAGDGVLPLSRAELARVHPNLWATATEVKDWTAQKGAHLPLRDTYWNVPVRRCGLCQG